MLLRCERSKRPSCPRPPLDTVALRANRPRLDLRHLFERSKGPSCPRPPLDTVALPSESTASGSLAPVRPDPDPSEASSNDEVSVHSESENERGASGSSSDEYVSDFDSEKVQGIFDDWVASLPLQSCKMLAVMLMETLQKRTNIKSTAAALEAAWITGFNEKTIRGYRK